MFLVLTCFIILLSFSRFTITINRKTLWWSTVVRITLVIPVRCTCMYYVHHIRPARHFVESWTYPAKIEHISTRIPHILTRKPRFPTRASTISFSQRGVSGAPLGRPGRLRVRRALQNREIGCWGRTWASFSRLARLMELSTCHAVSKCGSNGA